MATKLVSPSEIQNELSRIWDSLEAVNKIRASLFNLIFYTSKKGPVNYLETIAKKVIEKFPARIIFVSADMESKEDFLQTEVSIVPASKAEYDIACDFIKIEVSKERLQRIPFVILPNLIPDLPIYVVWAEDPSQENPFFHQLTELATRMIFDSESANNLSSFAETLLKIYHPSSCDIADLNWARMESWRDLLSSTFYSQERLHQLKNTKNIQIFYNAQQTQSYIHTELQSIYLQTWLASQLNWKIEKMVKIKDNSLVYNYLKENGKSVEVCIYPEFYSEIQSGTIVSLDLLTEQEEHFSFGRDLSFPHQISMRFSTLEKCEIPLKYIFSKSESGQSLVKEISHKGTSAHYLKLLNKILHDFKR